LLSKGSSGGVEYYHCGAKESSTNDKLSLVLLHGARFTKEDWKTGGLLDRFCSISSLSVLALDLDVSSTYKELIAVLEALTTQDKLIPKLPVALVTPSASGKTMSTWITATANNNNNNNDDDMTKYIRYWIPVAPGSVQSIPAETLKSTVSTQKNNSHHQISILAIYGDKDRGGKTVSELLGTAAGAKVVEIPGSHPCYLDSPDEFVQQIQTFLSL